MSTISLRLRESLHEKVPDLAEQEDVSIKQFITVTVAEKISALVAEEYLTARAQRGSREKFRRVLAKVRDVGPVPGDELNCHRGRTRKPNKGIQPTRKKPARG